MPLFPSDEMHTLQISSPSEVGESKPGTGRAPGLGAKRKSRCVSPSGVNVSYSLRYTGNTKGFNYHRILISNNNKNSF